MKITLKLAPVTSALLLSLLSPLSHAEIDVISSVPDQAKEWNAFADKLLTLSKQLTARSPHHTKTRTGGYSGKPEFYKEERYIETETDRHTSTVKWESAKPEQLHSIEVKLHDESGRVERDFSASYLTTHHNAPIQTLITLHYYNGDLHAFRSFDASHVRVYEACRGTLDGKKVKLELDDDYGEIAQAMSVEGGIMSSPLYKACFGDRHADKTQLQIPSF